MVVQTWSNTTIERGDYVNREGVGVKHATFMLLCSSVVVASLAAQTIPDDSHPAQEAQGVVSVDVREAVLRYQISTWKLAAATYCVKVDGQDADRRFLTRFYPLPVKGASGCRKQTPSKLPKFLYTIVDKHTKKNSVIFDIGEIRWVKQTEAEVDGGYDCASECMAAGEYRVVWDGTGWTVTAFDIRVQS